MRNFGRGIGSSRCDLLEDVRTAFFEAELGDRVWANRSPDPVVLGGVIDGKGSVRAGWSGSRGTHGGYHIELGGCGVLGVLR